MLMSSGTGARNALLAAPFIALIASLVLFMLSIFYQDEEISSLLTMASIATLFTAWWLYFLGRRAYEKEKAAEEARGAVVTVLQCEKCGFREEREFKEGDYVFKKVGECAKCGGAWIISAIYAKPLERKR